MGDDLWPGEAQNLNLKLNLTFKGQGLFSNKTTGILTKVFAPMIQILYYQVGGVLTHPDTHTNAGNDNTRRPKLASGENDTIKTNL